MALLCDGDLELEVSYGSIDKDPQCCFGIRIALRWGGEPLINPAIWKSVIDREGAPDAIWLYDWGSCPILHALERSLQTNEPAIAEPLEPSFEFCIYPPGTSYYPYPGGWEVVYRTPEAERQHQDDISRLTQEGPGPDDECSVLLNLNAWCLKGGFFSATGFGVIMRVKQSELRTFLDALRGEWEASGGKTRESD